MHIHLVDKWLCLQTNFYKSHQRPVCQSSQELLSATQTGQLFSRDHGKTLHSHFTFVINLFSSVPKPYSASNKGCPISSVSNTSGTTATVVNYKYVQQNYLMYHFCTLNTFVSCRKHLPFPSFITIIKRECRLLQPIYILSLHFLFAQTLTPAPFQVKETLSRCLWSYQWLNNSKVTSG